MCVAQCTPEVLEWSAKLLLECHSSSWRRLLASPRPHSPFFFFFPIIRGAHGAPFPSPIFFSFSFSLLCPRAPSRDRVNELFRSSTTFSCSKGLSSDFLCFWTWACTSAASVRSPPAAPPDAGQPVQRARKDAHASKQLQGILFFYGSLNTCRKRGGPSQHGKPRK